MQIKTQNKPKNQIDENHVALKAFFNITQMWNINAESQRILLGNIPKATFYRWKEHLKGALPADTLDRISYILGIYKALRILLPNEDSANRWIHKPNQAPLFHGHTALEKLLKGKLIDIVEVRRYLDAERSW